MKPMTDEMFALSTRSKKASTLEELVAKLDAAGYWGEASLTTDKKQEHVLFKIKTLTHEPYAEPEDVVEWIEDTYPNAEAGFLTEAELMEIAEHACLKQWHPDVLIDALDMILGEAA